MRKRLEHADSGDDQHTVARMSSAYRSLAKSRNVPIERVLEAAAENRLVDIVRLHDHAADRRVQERSLARDEHLHRLRMLGIWQRRYEHLK